MYEIIKFQNKTAIAFALCVNKVLYLPYYIILKGFFTFTKRKTRKSTNLIKEKVQDNKSVGISRIYICFIFICCSSKILTKANTLQLNSYFLVLMNKK